jgi:primosomal protein N' (replication factor Y)
LTGAGTEKADSELRKLFPQSKIIVIDQENPDHHDLAETDIIIGTQYVFDFIDWEKIQTVGVINADTLFYLPDYRSLEKTYNLLAKLGKYLADEDKEMICQTMTPDNYIFTALKQFDQQLFYNEEIRERKDLHYPPLARLIKLIFQSMDFNTGEEETKEVYNTLKLNVSTMGGSLPAGGHGAFGGENNKNIIVNPPVLAYTQQVRGRFRWQIVIKILDQKINLEFLKLLPDKVIIDIDPESLL